MIFGKNHAKEVFANSWIILITIPMSILVGFAKGSIVGGLLLLFLTAVAYVIFWISPPFRFFMLSSSKYDIFLKNYSSIARQCDQLWRKKEVLNEASKASFIRSKTKFIRDEKIFLALLLVQPDNEREAWHVAYFSPEKNEWVSTSVQLNDSNISSDQVAKLIQTGTVSEISGGKKGVRPQ